MVSRHDVLLSLIDNLESSMGPLPLPGRSALPKAIGPIVTAFQKLGEEALAAGLPLDDVMTAALEHLQEQFQRAGDTGGSSATMRTAAMALTALATGYQTASEASDQPLPPQPLEVTRLSALHRINRAATSNLELNEMLETVVKEVASTTSSDACEVFLYDDTTGLLTLRAEVGLNPASVNAVTVRLGVGITGKAALEAQVISAPDAREHPAFLAHISIGEELYTSQVSVPIVTPAHHQLIGVMNIHSIDRREPEPGELEFLQTVAGELAISIENAMRYSQTDERLRQKVAELGTLQRVSRIVASTLDLRTVLRLISEQAMELIHAEAAAVFRLDHQRGHSSPSTPTIEYRVGPERELAHIEDRDNLVTEVIRLGAAKTGRVRFTDGTASLLCLPLRTARDSMGALCFRLNSRMAPDDDTLGILQAFSDSAALAIENAQLYQDAMASIQTQSALVQEMHHRVRNNLQTVAALLSLQLRTAEDAPWSTEMREAISRIQSIAAVHDLLSDETRLGGTTLDVIARLVAEDAHSTLIPPGLKVRFTIEPSTLRIPTRQATIISLLINELTANAISHGFEGRQEGDVRIRGWEERGFANIEVYNDGKGVPSGFDPAESPGLGMRITQRLVTSDLKGSFTITSSDRGTTALIRFPIQDDA